MDDTNTSQTSGSKSNMGMLIGGIALAGIIGLGAFMLMRGNNSAQSDSSVESGSSGSSAPTGTPTQPPVGSSLGTTPGSEEVKSFTLEAGSFYFKPNQITVKKGDTVRVTITSVDMMHNFAIAELNVKGEITPSGKSSTVEFVADQAGEFEFYCEVGQHRQRGQVGTLVVEE